MADFAAVLRKTVEGLGENTPEMREKVYAKARATIEKKLASITPKPSKSVITRQMNALEDAIREVESDFAVADAPLEDLDRILSEAEENEAEVAEEAAVSAPADESRELEPEEPVAESGEEPEIPKKPADAATGPEHELNEPEGPDAIFEELQQRQQENGEHGRRWLAPLIVLILLVAVAGGAWLGRDMVKQYTGFDIAALLGSGPSASPEKPVVAPEEPKESSAGGQTGSQTAGQTGSQTESSPPAAAENKPPEKFTQRLKADGQEVDEGPVGGTPGVGEGSSVAPASQSAAEGSSQNQAGSEMPQPQPQAVAVGQKAYLYEEGTSTDQATAEAGNVVWSVIQEKPGGNAPEEPAIHGVLEIPDKNVSLKITIRRNADQTLPASHIVEVVFETPDGFGGGGIAEMSRVAMKDSEQATGSPLLGVPAKISDGFFLVALTDAKAAVDTNTTLLQHGEWIDIPVVYTSGRRALFTMEKGIPGNRVFDEVMKSWKDAGSGSDSN